MFDLFLLILSFCRPARILRWSAFLLTVTIGWLALENSTLQAYIQERERRNGYREQVDQLKQQQKQLENDIADLKAGGFRLEKAIRERFHLIKPGEKIIYIESPGDKTPAPDSREQLSTALLQSAAASPTPSPASAEATEETDGDKAPVAKKPAKAAAEDEPAQPAAKKKSATTPAEPVARASVTRKSAGAKSTTRGTESGAKSSKSSTKAKRTKKRSAATQPDNQ